MLIIIKLDYDGGLCQVVMGGDSCLKGHEFISQRWIPIGIGMTGT